MKNNTSNPSPNSAATQNTVGLETDTAATTRKGVSDNITELGEVGSFGDMYIARGERGVNSCGIDNIGEE